MINGIVTGIDDERTYPIVCEQPARRTATRTQNDAIAAPGGRIKVASADQRTRSAGSQIKFRVATSFMAYRYRADVRSAGLERQTRFTTSSADPASSPRRACGQELAASGD